MEWQACIRVQFTGVRNDSRRLTFAGGCMRKMHATTEGKTQSSSLEEDLSKQQNNLGHHQLSVEFCKGFAIWSHWLTEQHFILAEYFQSAVMTCSFEYQIIIFEKLYSHNAADTFVDFRYHSRVFGWH